MDFRVMGFDAPLINTLHHLLDSTVDDYPSSGDNKSSVASAAGANAPSRAYVRDARAMASTPADVKELPNSYQFIIDMPGLGAGDIKVEVEDDNVLVISGERKRNEDQDQQKETKYLRMERRMGKFMRKFALPENANTGSGISAVCKDGVLTVTVEKLPPPEPKKPKTIQVQIA
ncbi:hypothetical protein V2J09_010068 [Rumex salicifolius]